MRCRHILVLVQVVLCIPSHGQDSSNDRVVRAEHMCEQGDFQAALDQLAPLISNSGAGQNDGDIGMALNVQGLAYQGLDEYEKSRMAFERALKILQDLPHQQSEYASTLNNLGGLKAELGQLDESRILRLHARKLYASLDDHYALSHVDRDLALVDLGQRNTRAARRELAEAVHEFSRCTGTSEADRAELIQIDALVSFAERNYQRSLNAIEQVIGLWSKQYGDSYYVLGNAYVLRGRARAALGDFESAKSDVELALKILSDNRKQNSIPYAMAEMVYAKLLRREGMQDRAARMEKEAQLQMEQIRNRRSIAGTISVQSLR